MMREVSLETLPNVNIRDPSHDKNLPIMSVTGSINQNVFKKMSFDVGVTFPLSQDLELGDKDLNYNLVEVSKAKNTKKYTTPSK